MADKNDRCTVVREGKIFVFDNFLVIGLNPLSANEAQIFSYAKGDFSPVDRLAVISTGLLMMQRLIDSITDLQTRIILDESNR